MYIVIGEESANELSSKYLVLELDTLRYPGSEKTITAYCVIDNEHISLMDIPNMEQWVELHTKLIENYKKRNWKFCIDAIEKLRGTFDGELDTFYDDLEKRASVFNQFPPAEDWDGIINQAIIETEL